METWLSFLGRLHPLLLHLPIGALALLAVAELWTRRAGARQLERSTRVLLCGVTALAAGASAATGWLLGDDLGSSGVTFERHRNLGIAFAAVVVLATLFAAIDVRRAYGTLLAVALLLLLPVGHLGAEMTHGANFLFEPFAEQETNVDPETPKAPTATGEYATVVAPILEATCTRCHGAKKQKGGLALHEPALLFVAGDSGLAPVTPGAPEASEIVRRMRLELEHDEHMPPPSKPQPDAEQIDAIEAWIARGAPAGSADVGTADVARVAPPAAELEPEPELAADAVAALRAEHVHVEVIDPEPQLLWIDFRARPATDDAFACEHLARLAPFVAELDLARTAVGDGTLALAGDMPRLERIDLSRTACTADGLAALRAHPTLATLNLTGTRVDDAALEHLAAVPGLRRLYATDTGLTPEALAELAQRLPELVVIGTPYEPARPLEVEPEVVMGTPSALDPVNTLCPVSGQPVDPAFRVVHAGKVVGFCCGECPRRFWAAPEDFPLDGQ